MRELVVSSESPESPGVPSSSSFWDCRILAFFLYFLAVLEDSKENDDETERNCAEDEDHSDDAKFGAKSSWSERRPVELAGILFAEERREQGRSECPRKYFGEVYPALTLW